MRRHDERRHDDEHEMSTLVGGAASAAEPDGLVQGGPLVVDTSAADPKTLDPKFTKKSMNAD